MLERTLPHMIAHLILCEMTYGKLAGKVPIPFWVQEGIAQLQEDSKYGRRRAVNRELHRQSKSLKVFSIGTLKTPPYSDTTLDKHVRYAPNLEIQQTLTGQPKKSNLEGNVKTYYDRTLCLVGFMRDHYGRKNFGDFLETIRDEEPYEEALRKLRRKKTTEEDIESDCKAYMEKIEGLDYAPE